jgi:Flp pilus assembly protein TadD
MPARPIAAALVLFLVPGIAAAQSLPESFEQCRRAEDPRSGIAACEDALKSPALLQTERARALVTLATYRRQAGELAEALAALDKAAAIAPRAPLIPAERAIVLHMSGDLSGAKKAHAQAFSRGPGSPMMLNNRGVTNLALGDTAGAVADFDAALSLMEGDATILANRAAARCSAGDADGSVADRLAAIERGDLHAAELEAAMAAAGFGGEGALEQWTSAGCPGAPAPDFL